jgi:hypothetical protein
MVRGASHFSRPSWSNDGTLEKISFLMSSFVSFHAVEVLAVFPNFFSCFVRFAYKSVVHFNGLELWLFGVSNFVGEDV